MKTFPIEHSKPTPKKRLQKTREIHLRKKKSFNPFDLLHCSRNEWETVMRTTCPKKFLINPTLNGKDEMKIPIMMEKEA